MIVAGAPLQLVGRFKNHAELGEGIRVILRSWEGPTRPGEVGRERFTEHLFPRDQRKHEMHPRHPTGYDPVTLDRSASVSPSCSYYRELCRLGRFRWAERRHA